MANDVRLRTVRVSRFGLCLGAFTALALLPASAAAAPTYTDIALGDGAGISYRRIESATDAQFDAIKLLPFMSQQELNATPLFPRGAPGVAIFDYDRDGDQDIYVSNGPGRANSLYRSKRAQGGGTNFEDVASAAGVAATSMDSTGVCYGDVDNDGDDDLYVLGRMEPNRFFRNNGNGTFTDITAAAGLGAGIFGHTSCSMGDLHNDGLLDIAVSNTFDWARQDAIFTDLFDFNHANQLFKNQGGNVFSDVSASSGFQNLTPALPPDVATISWSIAMVDIDLDGDVDVMHTDDQAAMPPAVFAGVNRGYVQIFLNNGSGALTNATHATPNPTDPLNAEPGQWMGLSFGDIDCSGTMDYFATSLGSNFVQQFGAPVPPTLFNSRWYLGNGNGTFTNPGTAPPGPFGWGTAMIDYDNDGDTDITYFGNMDGGPFISADNPGIMLSNQGCTANFAPDFAAFGATAERNQRSEIKGVAVGDLNDDGYADLVHAAAQIGTNLPMVPFLYAELFGGPHAHHAMYMPTFMNIGPNEWEWGGLTTDDGTLGVQISSGGTNRWAKFTLRGSVGTTPAGKVNRSGIGAVVFFKPRNGKQVMSPVLGGSSHESQHSLTQMFGLGTASTGTVEVLWPGGARNRLYDVEKSERLTLPEIPCSFTASWPSKNAYKQCVNKALNDLKNAGVINNAYRQRLRDSAIQAYEDTH
jgi:enediyne biosynthesis protein E4